MVLILVLYILLSWLKSNGAVCRAPTEATRWTGPRQWSGTPETEEVMSEEHKAL